MITCEFNKCCVAIINGAEDIVFDTLGGNQMANIIMPGGENQVFIQREEYKTEWFKKSCVNVVKDMLRQLRQSK